MKSKKDKKRLALVLTALILVLTASADRAMAYFTTNVTAAGERKLRLAATTTQIDEGDKVPEWTKHIRIRNAAAEAGGQACYVRVKVFIGETSYDDGSGVRKERLTFEDPDGGWKKGTKPDGDGSDYYYYKEALPPGGVTSELLVHIDAAGMEEDFNVIVVQEYTPAGLYDGENFDPETAEWTAQADPVPAADGGGKEADAQ